jgi:hypothetical protein
MVNILTRTSVFYLKSADPQGRSGNLIVRDGGVPSK